MYVGNSILRRFEVILVTIITPFMSSYRNDMPIPYLHNAF